MRIIAGKHKGRRILSPSGKGVRPTSSKMRESMFNMLISRGYLREDETKVIDLCCGTGALGLEALSRGAALVVFIDGSREHLKLAKYNIAHFGEESKSIVLRANAEYLRMAQDSFDLVLIDPPYFKGVANKALSSLWEKGWLAENAAIMVELPEKENLLYDPSKYQEIVTRKYGNSKFILLEKINSHSILEDI